MALPACPEADAPPPAEPPVVQSATRVVPDTAGVANWLVTDGVAIAAIVGDDVVILERGASGWVESTVQPAAELGLSLAFYSIAVGDGVVAVGGVNENTGAVSVLVLEDRDGWTRTSELELDGGALPQYPDVFVDDGSIVVGPASDDGRDITVFERDGAGWRVAARIPAGSEGQQVQTLAVGGGAIAAATRTRNAIDAEVHVYRADSDGVWTGASVWRGQAPFNVDLAVSDQRLYVGWWDQDGPRLLGFTYAGGTWTEADAPAPVEPNINPKLAGDVLVLAADFAETAGSGPPPPRFYWPSPEPGVGWIELPVTGDLPGPAAGDYYGWYTAAAGDLVVVTAPRAEDDHGALFIHDIAAATP